VSSQSAVGGVGGVAGAREGEEAVDDSNSEAMVGGGTMRLHDVGTVGSCS
jgi:hypothetical protein